MDNSKVHPVYEQMEKLDIKPVWNVPYKFDFNAAVELYWAQIKQQFRKNLLQRMLEHTSSLDAPLKPALMDAIFETSTDSIPRYIDRGLRSLEAEATEMEEALNWQENIE